MHDTTTTLGRTLDTVTAQPHAPSTEIEKTDVVSTHVLVEQEKVDRLRDLSKKTRIAQSEYLREAVDDLLSKYDRKDR